MLTRRYINFKASTLTALSVLLASCSSVETQSYVVNPDSVVESARISTDADFSRYRKLQAIDMGIFFPSSAVTSPADLDRIRQIFRQSFLEELDGYEIVTEPGPETMAVQGTLIDFREASYQDTMSLQSELRSMAAPGKIIFLMEMRDSESNKVLARAADAARAPSIADDEGEATDWSSVEDAAAHWAALFRRFLDENLGT